MYTSVLSCSTFNCECLVERDQSSKGSVNPTASRCPAKADSGMPSRSLIERPLHFLGLFFLDQIAGYNLTETLTAFATRPSSPSL